MESTSNVMNTNCPKCINGMLEKLGFISLGEVIELNNLDEKNSDLGLCLYVCSVDECGYTEMKAIPGTLTTAKRIMRQQLFKQYHQSTVTSLLK
ncbi:hypothetical protein B4102_2180 [Heyndrickxia sporothermodurans]|uniref:Uncharacterized protein n=1 Tax=Heyndrickxia sporothermodurans TaxID=46224 RepID=A0A150LI86_9BACI|nr:hypothetical protein [Heyndrickxia sporothermodurans]KYD11452.1 hypothetical protein B4102_2180 [Heyndrickxia sporothermodurans]